MVHFPESFLPDAPGSSSQMVVPPPPAPYQDPDAHATPCGPGDGGAGLRGYLLKQYKAGKLPAEAVCTLSYHAVRAGATNVADLALDPKSRKQAEHLRKVIEARSLQSFYVAQVPMWVEDEGTGFEGRKMVDFPMNLPHECFAKQFAQCPTDWDPSTHDGSRLSPQFYDHPVYESKGPKACPVGYFSDAVPHTNKDSFFAFLHEQHHIG